MSKIGKDDIIEAVKAMPALELSELVKELQPVRMEPDKIAAVIKNIVENAIKFNRAPHPEVHIDAVAEEGFAGLSVRDNGPGIAPEEHDRIFERFYQVEDSFTGQIEGPGLGLAVVRLIITAHGGKVGVSSSPGGGATFRFLLPLAT